MFVLGVFIEHKNILCKRKLHIERGMFVKKYVIRFFYDFLTWVCSKPQLSIFSTRILSLIIKHTEFDNFCIYLLCFCLCLRVLLTFQVILTLIFCFALLVSFFRQCYFIQLLCSHSVKLLNCKEPNSCFFKN